MKRKWDCRLGHSIAQSPFPRFCIKNAEKRPRPIRAWMTPVHVRQRPLCITLALNKLWSHDFDEGLKVEE